MKSNLVGLAVFPGHASMLLYGLLHLAGVKEADIAQCQSDTEHHGTI